MNKKHKKKLINYCWRKCRGLCNEALLPDCSPACESYCVNKEATAPVVPPQVMKKWEDLYDKVMKGSDVGCQPYFAPPGADSATKITRKRYTEQTVNQNVVKVALLRQIRPREEHDVEQKSEEDKKSELPKCKSCHQTDQDLVKILNTPPIEVAYRNYVGKHKGAVPEKEGSAVKVTSLPAGAKAGIINPNVKRVEFMQIAKTMTDIDEDLLKGVEEVWGAVGPLLIECDDREKRKIMNQIHLNLKNKVEIQKEVLGLILAENEESLAEFEQGLSADLDKKYDALLQETRARLEKDSAYAIDCLLKQYEDKNRFEIEWYRKEGMEKYQERVRLFTQFCNLWMRIIEASENRSRLNDNFLALKDGRLIAEIQNQEEHRILESIAHLNMDHEMIQTTLADFLYKRDLDVTRLTENVEELNKKADIWKNLVKDLLTQFQKFITFALDEQPVQTQYLLSLDELYNHFLDDYLKAERESTAQILQKTAEERVRLLYPTCGPPDRLSQENSATPDTTSSVGTETGEPKCLVPDYLMSAITTGEFPQEPQSYDELTYRKEQELEAVVQTFGYEPSENVTWDTESTMDFKEALNYQTRPPKSPEVIIEEDCADINELTRATINSVLNLIHEKPEVMKGYITF
ncbi:hypothetical protein GE061_016485 [Apolygus lucorum]|uniref:Uncharacterized protein n=1 Tax=Apolygus lucorum TaxID=248454 RepID=A0A6A4K5C1_APOLU|nr:hypothetical protein GE061_016485 [Apolygus lucorum]